jgi:hypothetical protein
VTLIRKTGASTYCVQPDSRWQQAVKTVAAASMTTDAAASVFTVTGEVEAEFMAYVDTALVSSGNLTLSLGTAGSTTAFCPATPKTGLAANLWWAGTSVPAAVLAVPSKYLIAAGADVVLTTGTADASTGQVTVFARWRPVSTDGVLSAAS